MNKNIIILTEKEYYRRYNNYKSDRHKRYLHTLKVTFAKNLLKDVKFIKIEDFENIEENDFVTKKNYDTSIIRNAK